MISSEKTRCTISISKDILAQINDYCDENGYTLSGFFMAAAKSKMQSDLLLEQLPQLTAAIKRATAIAEKYNFNDND